MFRMPLRAIIGMARGNTSRIKTTLRPFQQSRTETPLHGLRLRQCRRVGVSLFAFTFKLSKRDGSPSHRCRAFCGYQRLSVALLVLRWRARRMRTYLGRVVSDAALNFLEGT